MPKTNCYPFKPNCFAPFLSLFSLSNSAAKVEGLLVFSPDATFLAASASYKRENVEVVGREILIWDVKTRSLQHVLTLNGEPLALAFSTNNELFAIVLKNGQVNIWDISTKQLIDQLLAVPLDDNKEGLSPYAVASFSPDGKYLVAAYSQGVSRPYDVSFPKKPKNISLASIRLMKSSSMIRITSLFNSSGFKDIRFVKVKGRVTALAFSPQADILFATSGDSGTIYSYTLADGKDWPNTEPGENFRFTKGSTEKISILSNQQKTEYLLLHGGTKVAINGWLVDSTLSGQSKLPQYSFTLPNYNNARICQIIAVTPEFIFTISNKCTESNISNSSKVIHNTFRVENAISGLMYTILDRIHPISDFYESIPDDWVVMSPNGSMVAIYDKENGLRLSLLDTESIGSFLNIDDLQRAKENASNRFSYLPIFSISTMNDFEFSKSDASWSKAFHLDELIVNGVPQQLGVIIAPKKDHSLVAKVEHTASYFAKEKQTVLAISLPRNRTNKLRMLVESLFSTASWDDALEDVIKTLWIESFSKLLSSKFLIIDNAERLDAKTLNHLIQHGSNESIPSNCILIGRNEKLLRTLKADLSLAIRSTLIPYEDFCAFYDRDVSQENDGVFRTKITKKPDKATRPRTIQENRDIERERERKRDLANLNNQGGDKVNPDEAKAP